MPPGTHSDGQHAFTKPYKKLNIHKPHTLLSQSSVLGFPKFFLSGDIALSILPPHNHRFWGWPHLLHALWAQYLQFAAREGVWDSVNREHWQHFMKSLFSHSMHATQSTWAQHLQKWVLSSTSVVDRHLQHSFVDRLLFSFARGTNAFESIVIGRYWSRVWFSSGTGVSLLVKCCGWSLKLTRLLWWHLVFYVEKPCECCSLLFPWLYSKIANDSQTSPSYHWILMGSLWLRK